MWNVRLGSPEDVNPHAACTLRLEHLSIIFRHVCDICVLLFSTRFQYQITREKSRSTQLVRFMSIIWENVSTSQFYLQTNSIKYIKRLIYSCIKFWIKIWILQFCKLHFPLSKLFNSRQIWNVKGLKYFNDSWKFLLLQYIRIINVYKTQSSWMFRSLVYIVVWFSGIWFILKINIF